MGLFINILSISLLYHPSMDLQTRQMFLQIVGLILRFNAAVATVVSFTTHLYGKIPYHTSALSGAAWVAELLQGHPEHIQCELGVHKHVFWFLVSFLSSNNWSTTFLQCFAGRATCHFFIQMCHQVICVSCCRAFSMLKWYNFKVGSFILSFKLLISIFQVLFKDAFHILFQPLLYWLCLPAQSQWPSFLIY